MKTNKQFEDMVARNSSLEERNIHLEKLLKDAKMLLEIVRLDKRLLKAQLCKLGVKPEVE